MARSAPWERRSRPAAAAPARATNSSDRRCPRQALRPLGIAGCEGWVSSGWLSSVTICRAAPAAFSAKAGTRAWPNRARQREERRERPTTIWVTLLRRA